MSKSLQEQHAAVEPPDPPSMTDDVVDMGLTDRATRTLSDVLGDPPTRPLLLRNQLSGPAPPIAPDPDGAAAVASRPPPGLSDSLSTTQMRRIVADIHEGRDPVAYDFVYSGIDLLEEEVDEWFPTQEWQLPRLQAAQRAFEWDWQLEFHGQISWDDTNKDTKENFVREALAALSLPDATQRESALGKIMYIVLGRWAQTAKPEANRTIGKSPKHVASPHQVDAMGEGVRLLIAAGGLPIVWKALRTVFEQIWVDDDHQHMTSADFQLMDDELKNLMTVIYIAILIALSPLTPSAADIKDPLLELDPPLDRFMLHAAARLRWDEHEVLPSTQILLLFWKSILLVFGGLKQVAEAKRATSETCGDGDRANLITASPLDYHVFRQEIISKYPAYMPPKPLIALEPENTSFLPPLPNQQSCNTGASGIVPAPPHMQGGGTSILHKPVHIATPAPSPPPSPGVGKGAKKQNYQTNQNFPFLYPPMDDMGNPKRAVTAALGLGQLFTGRKWEGSDIPASIVEAGELFSTRVRMTRATRQLWDERERFLRFERGWETEDEDAEDLDDLCLNELTADEQAEIRALKLTKSDDEATKKEPPIDLGPRKEVDPAVMRRLLAVDQFYRESLPQLQSLVIVLLKAIMANVSMTGALPPPPRIVPPSLNGVGATKGNEKGHEKGVDKGHEKPHEKNHEKGHENRQEKGHENRHENRYEKGGLPGAPHEAPDLTPEELVSTRAREIATKAVTGILLLLLKWFKISHVLKFEYLTQLLLDSNYLPLVLRFFASNDVQQLIGNNIDRIELSFFYFCNKSSRNSKQGPPCTGGSSSEDEAVPPPIRRSSLPPTFLSSQDGNNGGSGLGPGQAVQPRPEVDELGYPVNPLPGQPLKEYSRRNFTTLINYLRVMQKVCKNKAHRNLLLVSYKTATFIRKVLRVPQHELRLYALKLFKNQVPYCGRKWRQSNMRVITAIYLHCRPELRDEWLAGSDIDAEVAAALPLEQALRSLTHWFNMRRYRDSVAPDIWLHRQHHLDFFSRELERCQLNWHDAVPEASEGGEWDQEVPFW